TAQDLLHQKPGHRHRRVLQKIPGYSTIQDITAVHGHAQTLTQPTMRLTALGVTRRLANAKNIAYSALMSNAPHLRDLGKIRQVRTMRKGPDRIRPGLLPAACCLDVETQGTELLATVLGDVLRPPRRHPHPVDREVFHGVLERLGGLLLDHVGERAGRAGQRHVQGGLVRAVKEHPVNEAEVDHVDAKLGVDHIAQGLEDVLGLLLDLFIGEVGDRRVLGHACPPVSEWLSAWAVASFQAIQPSRAHLTRAGYLETPANATASSSTSSSGSSCPLDCISSRKASPIFIASPTGLPMT